MIDSDEQASPDDGAVSDEYDFLGPKSSAEPIDLVELQLWPPRQGYRRQNIPVWADLRFAEQSITTESWRLEIRLAQAELSAQFKGCSVEQGTRLGDDAKRLFEISTEHERGEVNLSQFGEAGAKLGAGIIDGIAANVSLQAGGKAEKLSTTSSERKFEVQHDRIKSLPNNRWRISELGGAFLDGTYLRAPGRNESGPPPLCELRVAGSKFSITLAVKARPQDLVLSIHPLKLKSWWPGSSEKPNKEAVAKLLVQSAATARFGRSGDERITLALNSLEGRRKKSSGDCE